MSFRKWGYRPNGSAKIFVLAAGESLPAGWHDTPAIIEDESKRTAEALTEAARNHAADDIEDEPTAPHVDEKAALLERARALGVMIDGRWGVERLTAEIEKASA